MVITGPFVRAQITIEYCAHEINKFPKFTWQQISLIMILILLGLRMKIEGGYPVLPLEKVISCSEFTRRPENLNARRIKRQNYPSRKTEMNPDIS
jgi:hypothetical protein